MKGHCLTAPQRSSYHFLPMRPMFHRILAILLTFAVLALGVNCTCSRAFGEMGSATSVSNAMDAMPCCAHHGRSHHCNRQEKQNSSHHPCSGVCEHCDRAVMNDVVASGDFSTPLHWTAIPMTAAFAADCVTDGSLNCGALTSSAYPPSTLAPTLLRLHCALLI